MGVIYEIDKIFEYGTGSIKIGFPATYKLSIESTKKWMRIAKTIKEVENPCYSRAIGVVLVDPDTNTLVSSGHNGPPVNCPQNDDPDYLAKVVWPQLTADEQSVALNKIDAVSDKLAFNSPLNVFTAEYGNCKTCPRKHIDAPSGKRLELCSCAHAEHNAVINAHRSVIGCYMICYCGVPCLECCKTIINAGIDKVVCIEKQIDYSLYSSRWVLGKSNVDLFIVSESWLNQS
jgi:deoxycytidylate deaminase